MWLMGNLLFINWQRLTFEKQLFVVTISLTVLINNLKSLSKLFSLSFFFLLWKFVISAGAILLIGCGWALWWKSENVNMSWVQLDEKQQEEKNWVIWERRTKCELYENEQETRPAFAGFKTSVKVKFRKNI
jgi:hypothetical protein